MWALIVSVSRVMLGRHYPTDVLGGAVVGAFQAWLVWEFYIALGWNVKVEEYLRTHLL